MATQYLSLTCDRCSDSFLCSDPCQLLCQACEHPPEEWDAAFNHIPRPGDVCNCCYREVELDSRWGLCSRCISAVPTQYDAWVATLPHPLPMDDSPVAPADWPMWVVLGLAVTLLITVSTMLIVSPL